MIVNNRPDSKGKAIGWLVYAAFLGVVGVALAGWIVDEFYLRGVRETTLGLGIAMFLMSGSVWLFCSEDFKKRNHIGGLPLVPFAFAISALTTIIALLGA